MANFDVSNAKFNREIRKMEVTDPCHADTFNNVFKTLINNDVALNSQYEEFKKEAEVKISNLDSNDKQARQEILRLQMRLDKEKTLKEIDDKTGIGFYDLFENNDNIDTEKSTVNAKSTDIEFGSKQKIEFKEVKFPSNFNNIELNLFDKKRSVVEIVSNKKNEIEILLPPDTAFKNNKIIIDNKVYNIENIEEVI